MFPANTKKWKKESDIVSLTNITSDGIWEWFPQTNFEYMSTRFWNILGYNIDDMDETPDSWLDIINPGDKDIAMKSVFEHFTSKGEIEYKVKVRYTHKDGKEVVVLCRGCVVEWLPNGKPWRVLGTHTDVTDIVKKDALHAKTKFIERMSHEIRSPLCTILNQCELMEDTVDTRVIQDTCKQLVRLSDDILNLSYINSNNVMTLNSKKENLSEVISNCITRHKMESKKKGLKMSVFFDDIPEIVEMDIGKFNQVLDNLLSNSIKYSDHGKIKVEVEYNLETQLCSVTIIDNGIGMHPDFHTKAFEELVQGDETMVGAGIGLSIARSLAEFMKGEVKILNSAPGKGTSMLFTCHLPENCNTKNTDFNILIADDMRTNRSILRRRIDYVSQQGIIVTDVVEAVDGSDAIKKFKERNGNYHLILMDCHMPIVDGFGATKEIHRLCKEEYKIKIVPVIAVTASASSEIHSKCSESGMITVVMKPYSESELLKAINSARSLH